MRRRSFPRNPRYWVQFECKHTKKERICEVAFHSALDACKQAAFEINDFEFVRMFRYSQGKIYRLMYAQRTWVQVPDCEFESRAKILEGILGKTLKELVS